MLQQLRLSFLLLLAAISCLPATSSAAGPGSVVGQSERFRVHIDDDYFSDETVLTVSEMADNDDMYSYGIPRTSGKLLKECVATETELVCRSNGRTLLAGVTYKKTLDATPECPARMAEFRYTCVKGCKKDVPRYLKINPWEC